MDCTCMCLSCSFFIWQTIRFSMLASSAWAGHRCENHTNQMACGPGLPHAVIRVVFGMAAQTPGTSMIVSEIYEAITLRTSPVLAHFGFVYIAGWLIEGGGVLQYRSVIPWYYKQCSADMNGIPQQCFAHGGTSRFRVCPWHSKAK
jgi:hypothetical protein